MLTHLHSLSFSFIDWEALSHHYYNVSMFAFWWELYHHYLTIINLHLGLNNVQYNRLMGRYVLYMM